MGRKRRNNKLSRGDVCGVGLDFIELLEETNQRSITDRTKLKDIYNEDFRNRDGVRDPNFSTVLFALKKCNKARVTISGHVFFNPNVRVRGHDQWFRPRRDRQNSPTPSISDGDPSSPLTGQQESNPPSNPGPEGGVRARRKLAKEILQQLTTTDRSKFIADKNGVQVFSDLNMEDGKVQIYVDSVGVYELKMFVENTGQDAVYFTYYTALHWLQCFTLEDTQKVTRQNPLCLEPGEKYEVTVGFKSDHVGDYSATLVFEFKENTHATTRPFHIVRFIDAVYRTELATLLGPTEPFRPRRINASEPERFEVDEGVPPDSSALNSLKYVEPLGQYIPPHYISQLIKLLKDDKSSQTLKGKFRELWSLVKSELDFQNYAERFDLLLHLEEDQMHVDIKRYDKENVPVMRDPENKKLLILEVPGVSENRPSVLRGDHLFLTKSEEAQLSSGTKYKGYVHNVELDQVKLGFSRRMLDSFINNMKFNVEFTFNRLPIKLQHRAVHKAVEHNLRDVLFPVGSGVMTPVSPPSLSFRDQKLERNAEQRNAVCNIVAGTSKPAPYLVFGPPGTGKTVTIVEAIKQVVINKPGAHILACAPSNSAADQLCERLITSKHVDAQKIYRLYASSRNTRDIPEVLKKNSNLDGSGSMIVFPCKEDLMVHKIIVSTLVTAGRSTFAQLQSRYRQEMQMEGVNKQRSLHLHTMTEVPLSKASNPQVLPAHCPGLVSGGFPVGHFSYIFVDEAGHAVEPETLIAVAGLMNAETGQLVLAGDPKQLGPILRSPFAIEHGLGLSLLERLMSQNELYQKGTTGFDNRYVTKLLQNYRSHPSILKVPNELFYDGELIPCADEISSLYCQWEHLPKKGFPIIFHGVTGKDERESASPSFFNTSEITNVISYLEKLLLTQTKKGISKLSPKEIGIIAPYRKQVEKIRKAIKISRGLRDCMGIEELKVGSVEEFQGQERKVIIISAVRSSKEFINLDEKFNIGFLKNEKRFNVAVTRAKALLIMIGNPLILSKDPTWSRFIDYCIEQEGYTGYDISSVEGTEEVVDRLLALNINEDISVETEESVVQQYLHPGWRHEH